MTGLLRIESRRTVALWLAPIMLAAAWLIYHQQYGDSYGVFWSDRSLAIRDVSQATWPLICGEAAWMAGRRRRRGMHEMLRTTPYPAWSRELITWAGTMLWALAVYIGIAAVFLVATWRQASWGGPSAGPIVVGLLMVLASGAIGFALGSYLPGRFTPPLAAVGLFVATGLPYSAETWYSFLSPLSHGELSVWGVAPDLSAPQSLFLLGVTGAALMSVIFASHREPVPGAMLLGSVGIAAIGVIATAHSVPNDAFSQPMQLSEMPISHITPACSYAPVSVCVHPAFKKQLSGLSAMVNRIAAPLVGLPGVPTRSIDSAIVVGAGGDVLGDPSSPAGEANLRRDGLFVYDQPPPRTIVFDPWRITHWPAEIALDLINARFTKGPPSDAQEAIAKWLSQRAGFSPDLSHVNSMFSVSYLDTQSAANRFGRLPVAERRAWLRTHFSALQTGQVSLEDLP